jgi:hypothetical protein
MKILLGDSNEKMERENIMSFMRENSREVETGHASLLPKAG